MNVHETIRALRAAGVRVKSRKRRWGARRMRFDFPAPLQGVILPWVLYGRTRREILLRVLEVVPQIEECRR